jgi:protein-disulfide isomerase
MALVEADVSAGLARRLMIIFMKKALFLAVAATLLACSNAPAQSGSETAAQFGNRTITVKELDEKWRAEDPAAHAEATQKLYEGRRNALEAIVADSVIAEAANGKGLSPDAFVEAELSRRAKPVTDGEVVAFYQANQNQMQGRALDVMAPAIARYLEEQRRQQARSALVAELRKAAPAVRVMIDAPRHEVALAATDPSVGNASAPVTIVEFSDFQCPFCQSVAPTLKRVRETYGDKVRIVWKDFPLTQIHPQAFKAGEAAHCAGEQGKFWEYHDRLFANQQALQPADLKKYGADLGLDAAKFNACVDSSKYGDRVRAGVEQGSKLGVNSTPTLYINGRVLSGAQPYETFVTVIDEELSRTK